MPARPRCSPRNMSRDAHVLYLAVIAVLIIIIVFAAALAVKSKRTVAHIKQVFGVHKHVLVGARTLRNKTRLLDAPANYDAAREAVDALIKRASPDDFGDNVRLSKACQHALADGKRLRAIIVLEIVRASSLLGPTPNEVDAAEAALAMEYLHTASLIVDDMPYFDNDEVRRNKETVHKRFGIDVAHMASTSLVAAAFQNLCRQVDWIKANCSEFKHVDSMSASLIAVAAQALGPYGASKGQLEEIEAKKESAEVARLKTASFFEMAFAVGWLVSGGGRDRLDDVKVAGQYFGVAYQIADDIADMEEDESTGQWNFANTYGLVAARRTAQQNLSACELALQRLNLCTSLWDEIFQKVRNSAQIV